MIIEADALSFSYPSVPVLKDISFSVKEGDFLAIIGPNGSGKTTLLRILLGQLKPTSGSLRLFGHPVGSFAQWGRVGYVPQKVAVERAFPGTVRELLGDVLPRKGVCSVLQLDDLLPFPFVQLSGGQQQRVLIALALQSAPKLLILDEPAAGIDSQRVKEFYRLLKSLNAEYHITILLVTHDVGMVPSCCKHVLGLNGTSCCCAAAKDTPHVLRKLYGEGFGAHQHA